MAARPRRARAARARPAPPAQRRRRLRRALGPLSVAGLAILKFAAKLKALLLLLPKLKLLTTSGSMLVSVAAYALIWGWTFAVGFVALLFVHEMGHVIQLRREGIKASGPDVHPVPRRRRRRRKLAGRQRARRGARRARRARARHARRRGAARRRRRATGNDFWRALAFTGFFLNLFNLLPVVPLDGGRAMAAMAPWMWFVGFAAMLALCSASSRTRS